LPAHRHKATGLDLPTLVAAVQDGAGRVTAVQRIYLQPGGRGKAGVASPKMGLGPMRDGAVRLAKPAPLMGLAEGIETALAAQSLFSVPVWATLGAARLGAVRLPACVTEIVLFADAGETGIRAAITASETYEARGLRVFIQAPPTGDWNDHLPGRAA
jgi:DNA primase